MLIFLLAAILCHLVGSHDLDRRDIVVTSFICLAAASATMCSTFGFDRSLTWTSGTIFVYPHSTTWRIDAEAPPPRNNMMYDFRDVSAVLQRHSHIYRTTGIPTVLISHVRLPSTYLFFGMETICTRDGNCVQRARRCLQQGKHVVIFFLRKSRSTGLYYIQQGGHHNVVLNIIDGLEIRPIPSFVPPADNPQDYMSAVRTALYPQDMAK